MKQFSNFFIFFRYIIDIKMSLTDKIRLSVHKMVEPIKR
jgi:hypothetical protein